MLAQTSQTPFLNVFSLGAIEISNQIHAAVNFVITPQNTVITNTENLREKPLFHQKSLYICPLDTPITV